MIMIYFIFDMIKMRKTISIKINYRYTSTIISLQRGKFEKFSQKLSILCKIIGIYKVILDQ